MRCYRQLHRLSAECHRGGRGKHIDHKPGHLQRQGITSGDMLARNDPLRKAHSLGSLALCQRPIGRDLDAGSPVQIQFRRKHGGVLRCNRGVMRRTILHDLCRIPGPATGSTLCQ